MSSSKMELFYIRLILLDYALFSLQTTSFLSLKWQKIWNLVLLNINTSSKYVFRLPYIL